MNKETKQKKKVNKWCIKTVHNRLVDLSNVMGRSKGVNFYRNNPLEILLKNFALWQEIVPHLDRNSQIKLGVLASLSLVVLFLILKRTKAIGEATNKKTGESQKRALSGKKEKKEKKDEE